VSSHLKVPLLLTGSLPSFLLRLPSLHFPRSSLAGPITAAFLKLWIVERSYYKGNSRFDVHESDLLPEPTFLELWIVEFIQLTNNRSL